MAHVLVSFTTEDGVSEWSPFELIDNGWLQLEFLHLVGLSDNIAELTCVTNLWLNGNCFQSVPPGVLAMTQLTFLNSTSNRLASLPPAIGQLTALEELFLERNCLVSLPRTVGLLRQLTKLTLGFNDLTSLPAELGELGSLQLLRVEHNKLHWLPRALDRLPAATTIVLNGNPLPLDVGKPHGSDDSRSKLPELFAATTSLLMIREPVADALVGLADLELPALVALEIVDAAFPNSVAMHKKWDLIVAVKHFRK